VVDDLEVNRIVFGELLADLGMVARLASSGSQAMELLEITGENPIDLVVTDYQMPELNGLDLVKAIRTRLDDVPILVLSSVDTDAIRKAFSSLNKVEFLTKPARASEIQTAIAKLLSASDVLVPARSGVSLARETLPRAQPEAEGQDKRRILIAEDNQVNRLVIENMLDSSVSALYFAENGKQAVAMFKTMDFDLVLMDISMPVMDGEAALKSIRAYEQAEGLSTVPVIALTAHAMEGDEARFVGLGFDGYVSKPMQKSALDRVLGKYSQPVAGPDRKSFGQ
ncbi:MAG: response regulator, partial [Pseudomonadota bacterium]